MNVFQENYNKLCIRYRELEGTADMLEQEVAQIRRACKVLRESEAELEADLAEATERGDTLERELEVSVLAHSKALERISYLEGVLHKVNDAMRAFAASQE